MPAGRSEIVGPMTRCGRPGPSRVLTDATHSAARRHSGRRDGSSRFTSSAPSAVTGVSWTEGGALPPGELSITTPDRIAEPVADGARMR